MSILCEQLATDMGRLADAMEIIARHLDPEAAKALGHKRLPNLKRPLADYATFDWSTIGARIVASDRSGPTEVEYRGIVCKRRSGEDKKGKAIWFNVVTGGTVADGNVTYERLITFRDGTPAEPLGDKVAAVVDRARQAPAAAPLQPAQPEGYVAMPIGPANPPPPKKLDPTLTIVYAEVHSEALKLLGTVPPQYLPESGDKAADVERKTAGLRALIAAGVKPAARTPEESAEYAKLCQEHATLSQWAREHHVDIPGHLLIQPADDTIQVGMKLATLKNVCGPAKAQAAVMRSELDKATQPRMELPRSEPGKSVPVMTPAQVRTWIETRMKRYDASKKNNLVQRGQAVEAISAVTHGAHGRIIRALFNCEIDEMNSAQSMALFEYVKPATHVEGGARQILPANINAAAELNALLNEGAK